jgi:hypothetical protein
MYPEQLLTVYILRFLLSVLYMSEKRDDLHKTDSMLAVLAMFRLARGIRFEVKGMLL